MDPRWVLERRGEKSREVIGWVLGGKGQRTGHCWAMGESLVGSQWLLGGRGKKSLSTQVGAGRERFEVRSLLGCEGEVNG